MFRSNNIYEVLNPIFYVCKVFGLSPFKLSSESYTKSKLNLCWSLSVVSFICIKTFFCLLNRPALQAGIISIISEIIDSYLGYVGMCCGILFECIFSNQIIKSVNEINTFDSNFRHILHIDLQKELQKSKTYLCLILMGTLTVLIISTTFTTRNLVRELSFKIIGEILLYIAPPIIGTLIEFQFCSTILCVKQRFNWLNKLIIKSSKKLDFDLKIRPSSQVVASGFLQDKTLYTFEKMRQKHHSLCTIAKRLNKAYSVQILFIVLQDFITIMLALFYSGKHLILDNHISAKYLLYSMHQMAISILKIVLLVLTCSNTVSEAQKTGYLINNAVSKQSRCKEELQLEVSFFTLQLFHENLEFTACRIFPINESLLLSIVGAITTYLVIVVQFELGGYF